MIRILANLNGKNMNKINTLNYITKAQLATRLKEEEETFLLGKKRSSKFFNTVLTFNILTPIAAIFASHFDLIPVGFAILTFIFCLLATIIGSFIAEELSPYDFYSYQYKEIDNEKKLQLRTLLLNYKEIQSYNSERIKEDRPWLNIDFDLVNQFVHQEKLKTVDDDLNKDYLHEKTESPKHLSTSL